MESYLSLDVRYNIRCCGSSENVPPGSVVRSITDCFSICPHVQDRNMLFVDFSKPSLLIDRVLDQAVPTSLWTSLTGSICSRTSHCATFWDSLSLILSPLLHRNFTPPSSLASCSLHFYLWKVPLWLAQKQWILKPPATLLPQSPATCNSFSLGHCISIILAHSDFLQASAQRLSFQRGLLEPLWKLEPPSPYSLSTLLRFVSFPDIHHYIILGTCLFVVYLLLLECKSHERNKFFLLCLLLYPQWL